ncbi:hypothetical protein [Curtobacterium sp. PsM8]|uniref:hypothetical protein n=1 Tax=Curtobacterium sp. PsM8 TaxID=3030532 RepID=UPI00263B35FC|nr:hypothetical protein [Curtobacterium sp. PsM8]MDN4648499.1 hypothetical protein [Curtobacterium sp. PsM8]
MKKVTQLLVGTAVVAAAIIGAATPANAAQANCTKTDELCSASINVSAKRSVVFATFFGTTSGKAQYDVVNGSGKVFCSGSIGYNNNGSCTFPSVYSGKVTFIFAKGNSRAGSVTVSAP